MKTHKLFSLCAALLLAATLLLSACGSPGAGSAAAGDTVGDAATIRLRSLLGTVGVADGDGNALDVEEGMGLYRDYAVDTQIESFAWIDLDAVKLAKLDEESTVTIRKMEKNLTIEVKSGSLFFYVAEPLAEDEEMNIRSSSMMVGIRGTCGWIEVPETGIMDVYLLEGTVTCTVSGGTATVTAGEVAHMFAGSETITVEQFGKDRILDFVLPEIDNIGLPLDDIPETAPSAEDASEPEGDDPMAAAAAAYREIVARPEDQNFTYEEAYIDPIVPSGVFDYALMWLNSHQQTPALLLRQVSASGFNVVEVFQYYPKQGVAHSHGCLAEGVDPTLRRHNSLYVPEQRQMIVGEEYYESSGNSEVWRYNLGSGGLIEDPHYWLETGRTALDDPGRGEIVWYGVTDLTGIDNMAELAQGPH